MTTATADIVKEVQLIFSNVQGDNNKVWYGRLHQNGDVYTEWGRVGENMQTKTYPGAGERKLDAKEREKLKKGYTHTTTIRGVSAPKEVGNVNLMDLAIKQISRGEPVLDALVRKLVTANVHRITSGSKITFNEQSGLFQTPLGVVTLPAIMEAYELLGRLQKFMKLSALDTSDGYDAANKYLRIIPQDFGRRLNIHRMFPDDSAIQAQRDLLESLEASYRAVTAPKKDDASPAVEEAEEKVFDITVKLASSKEVARIQKLFEATANRSHRHVYGMKVARVFELKVPTRSKAFAAYGKKMDNVWELWHGTRVCNVLSIMRSGLHVAPPRTAAIAGKMFGNGVYFSDQSTKSLNYATDYWHGGGRGGSDNFFMFLANVAMGKYHVPSGSRSSPPPQGYDSYFAKPGQSGIQNNEMIVFREDQFDLVRLVEFGDK